MGEVYLAEDTRLNRKVALKILPSEFTQDKDWVRRFEREARAVSGLNHPNILTIYDIGQFDSSSFIASEFIDGETLRQRMSESKLSLKEIDLPEGCTLGRMDSSEKEWWLSRNRWSWDRSF